MGCGHSGLHYNVDDRDILVEPLLDPIDIEIVLEEYPPPKPSRKKKASIYNEEDFNILDDRAKKVSSDACGSFESLVNSLTRGIYNDLEKVRIIFVWLGTQTSSSPGDTDDSPLSILHFVHQNKVSYAYMFARLCRTGGVPCVLIHGFAKSMAYQVGDDPETTRKLRNCWNAVYVEGEWRIVFPLWAFKDHSRQRGTVNGQEAMDFNEFFFLTDPEDFVNLAMAEDPAWQLIQKPYDLVKFTSIPHLRPSYFQHKVKITSEFKSCLTSSKGTTRICLISEDENWDGHFSYELSFFGSHVCDSTCIVQTGAELQRYVMMERQGMKWTFYVRFPVLGEYKLTINIGTDQGEFRFCHFKLYAEDLIDSVYPFPYNPGITGWGPSLQLEKGGLSSPSHRQSKCSIRVRKYCYFTFRVTKNVAVRCSLVHHKAPSKDLEKYVSFSIIDKRLDISVSVPEEGEYGLLIFCRDRNTNRETNVCNYLLSTVTAGIYSQKKTRLREGVTERNVRTRLRSLSRSFELEELSAAIAKFKKYDMQDNGDLKSALDQHEYLYTKQELKNAIGRRHLGTLNKAIRMSKISPYEFKLRNLIAEAETVRDHLINLNSFAHDVMELCQRTASEIHSYNTPKKQVHDVMIATFLLLGEQKKYLQNWKNIQSLLEVVGTQSVISRIHRFDSVNVSSDTSELVVEILNRQDKDSVHLASPAAAAFYVWASNVSKEIEQHTDKLRKQRQKRTILESFNKRMATLDL